MYPALVHLSRQTRKSLLFDEPERIDLFGKMSLSIARSRVSVSRTTILVEAIIRHITHIMKHAIVGGAKELCSVCDRMRGKATLRKKMSHQVLSAFLSY